MSIKPRIFSDSEDNAYPVTEETIHALERKCGIQFPEFLKSYYLEYDGLPVRRCHFHFLNDDFYLLKLATIAPGEMNIESLLTQRDFSEHIPEGWIPVGSASNEELFFFDPITEAVFLVDLNKGIPQLAAFSIEKFFEQLDQSFSEPSRKAE